MSLGFYKSDYAYFDGSDDESGDEGEYSEGDRTASRYSEAAVSMRYHDYPDEFPEEDEEFYDYIADEVRESAQSLYVPVLNKNFTGERLMRFLHYRSAVVTPSDLPSESDT